MFLSITGVKQFLSTFASKCYTSSQNACASRTIILYWKVLARTFLIATIRALHPRLSRNQSKGNNANTTKESLRLRLVKKASKADTRSDESEFVLSISPESATPADDSYSWLDRGWVPFSHNGPLRPPCIHAITIRLSSLHPPNSSPSS